MFSSNTSQVGATSSLAEAIDFDGTNDYLSRSTDLTGSADSKTFTFSCWLWQDDWSNSLQIYAQTNTIGLTTPFVIFSISSGTFNISAYSAAGTEILNASVASVANAARTFTHILVSVDLANTSNRAIYINDVAQSVSWTTYANTAIDFTQLYRGIGARPDGTVKNRTRLSNVFLDYTYRDLSIIANRRLFVTADLKPAVSQNSVVKYLQNNFAFPNSINNAKFFNNGSTVVYVGSTTDTAYSYDLSTPYDLKTAGGEASWQISGTGAWSGACFNSDGTKAYFANGNNATIYSHTNSTPFRIAGSTNVTATLSTAGTTGDMMLAHDDTQLYRLASASQGGTIQQFSFGTPGDITTLTFVGQISIDSNSKNIRSIYVDTLRGFVYTVDAGNFIREFQFGTPKVISSLTSTGRTYFTGSLDQYVAVSQDYMLLGSGANALLYNISNYDIRTAFYGQSTGGFQTPILYLPMNDPTAPGLNQGSGGNFTLTGTVARSGRGPNQYNAPYSDLDGVADYLLRTTPPTLIDNSNQFTLSFNISTDTATTVKRVIAFGSTQNVIFDVQKTSNKKILITANNSAFVAVLAAEIQTPLIENGRNYHVVMSFDLSSTSKRHCFINGQAASVTYTQYNNDVIGFAIGTTPRYRVGASIATSPGNFWDGRLGSVWFGTSYIDLSVPLNLAKFVTGTGIDAKPVDLGRNGELPTGTSPIIYLPMYGNDPGLNYGTGGDFTVTSGPYTGARGPNEYWGNLADFDGTTGYLSRTSALTGVSDGKIVSFSFFINVDTVTGAQTVLSIGPASNPGSPRLEIRLSGTSLGLIARKSEAIVVLNASFSSAFAIATTYHVCGCIDLSSTATRFVFVNGVQQTPTYTTYVNDTINFSSTNARVGANLADNVTTQYLNGRVSELYCTTEYIDFSQEANRLKFRDAFGNPVDLSAQITAAAIPTPAIYMRFPPTSFGTNLGTGGNFTVNGTILDGGQL